MEMIKLTNTKSTIKYRGVYNQILSQPILIIKKNLTEKNTQRTTKKYTGNAWRPENCFLNYLFLKDRNNADQPFNHK